MLTSLPTEVLDYVTDYLLFRDLKQLRLTSHRILSVVDARIFEQVHINCISKSGMSSGYLLPLKEPFLGGFDCDLYCEPPGFFCEHACYRGQIEVNTPDRLNQLVCSGKLGYIRNLSISTQFTMQDDNGGCTNDSVGHFMNEILPQKCPRLKLVDVYAILPTFEGENDWNVQKLLQNVDTAVAINMHVGFVTPGTLKASPPLVPLLSMNLKILSLQIFPFEVSFVIEFLSNNLLPDAVERLDITQLECPGAEEALSHFVSRTQSLVSLNLIDSLTLLESTSWIPSCVQNMILWDHRDSKSVPQSEYEEPRLLPNMKSIHFQTEFGSIVSRLSMPNLERFSICASNPWDLPELNIDWARIFATSSKVRQLICNNMTFENVARIVEHTPKLESLAVNLSLYQFTDEQCFDHLAILASQGYKMPRLNHLMLELRFVAPDQFYQVLQVFASRCPNLRAMYVDVNPSEEHQKQLLTPVRQRYVVDGISRVPVHESDWQNVDLSKVRVA